MGDVDQATSEIGSRSLDEAVEALLSSIHEKKTNEYMTTTADIVEIVYAELSELRAARPPLTIEHVISLEGVVRAQQSLLNHLEDLLEAARMACFGSDDSLPKMKEIAIQISPGLEAVKKNSVWDGSNGTKFSLDTKILSDQSDRAILNSEEQEVPVVPVVPVAPVFVPQEEVRIVSNPDVEKAPPVAPEPIPKATVAAPAEDLPLPTLPEEPTIPLPEEVAPPVRRRTRAVGDSVMGEDGVPVLRRKPRERSIIAEASVEEKKNPELSALAEDNEAAPPVVAAPVRRVVRRAKAPTDVGDPPAA